MDSTPNAGDRYLIKSVVHASEVLRAFHSPREVLPLREVVRRTGLGKATCFRLIYTLHECGFLEKVGRNAYRTLHAGIGKKQFRVGFGAQGQDSSFSREVTRSLLQAFSTIDNIELITVDNRYSPEVALKNADLLIRERIDLAIEFQTDEEVAAAIASKYLAAGVPLIAVDVPHPGAAYYGANNYEAGRIAGRHLGKWARQQWAGEVDELVLLELRRAGTPCRMRTQGVLSGLNDILPSAVLGAVVRFDGDGQFQSGLEVIRQHLRRSAARRTLVAAANDPSAIGALRAFQETGRTSQCAVVGQNGEPESRLVMREPATRLIGSVAYFPEKYGPALMDMTRKLLAGKAIPPAVFIQHRLLTPNNVDQHYPNDELHSS